MKLKTITQAAIFGFLGFALISDTEQLVSYLLGVALGTVILLVLESAYEDLNNR